MTFILRITYKLFSIVLLLITLLFAAYFIYLYNSIDNNITLNVPNESIKIYDSTNQEISTLGTYFYEPITIDEISPYVIDAFISTEDQTFFTHNGVNLTRIMKAILDNIKYQKAYSGASTITQQYIKNAFLSSEKSFERKITEIAYALKLEKQYTKNQILEAYLNSILFGGSIYGINMASKYYFNKEPKLLSISEAAMLAGMIQMPNYYNPYTNSSETNERKNLVLKNMYDESYITQDEYDKEIKIDVSTLVIDHLNNSNYLNSYIDYLYYYVNNDLNKNLIETGNKIYTYLNLDIQKEVNNILSDKYNYFQDDQIKCGIVVLDNNDYGILAIGGNRESTDYLVTNYCNTLIQPASTIKPILDYAPAFEYLGYGPATIIDDSKYTYTNGSKIENWDYLYKGSITLREALRESRNIPALKLYQTLGSDKAFSFAKKIGIEPLGEVYESDSIGGSTYGYTLLSIANAYQAFANLGKYKKASPVKYIKSNSYSYDYSNIIPKQVMKDSTVFLINSILHDVFKNSSFDLKNTYMMAKTGQTNYDSSTRLKYNYPDNATKDSLLIAYTKGITVGIYVSYDKLAEGCYLDSKKKQIPRVIMKHLMSMFAKDNEYYSDIDSVFKIKIYKDDGNIYYDQFNNNTSSYYEYFTKGYENYSIKESDDYKI